MTIKSRADLLAQVATDLPIQTSRQISSGDINGTVVNVIDSTMLPSVINLETNGVGQGDASVDTAALKAAIALVDNLATRAIIQLPAAVITINETIDIADGDFTIRGYGRRATKIISAVIGAPTFRLTGNVAYLGLEDFGMEGNSLTGASGNGHAFALWKGNTTGSAVPQIVNMHRVTIRGFRGDDTEGSTTASADFVSLGAMVACAINLKGALACLIKDVDIQACGGGLYVAQTQNCALENVTASNCDVFGLVCYRNAALVVSSGDIQDCCNNGTALTVPVSLPSANIRIYRDEGTKIIGLKTKNAGGGSQIYEQEGVGTEYIGLWLQTTMTADVPHKGVILSDCSGAKIRGGFFGMTLTAFPSQKHLPIEVISTQNTLPCSANIDGVQMVHPPGQNVSAYIRIAGNAGNRFACINISNNIFGNRAAPSAGHTADDGILIQNANLVASVIKNNLFHAAQDVTITNGVRYASVTEGDDNRVGPNAFITTGTGVITNQYSGVTPTN